MNDRPPLFDRMILRTRRRRADAAGAGNFLLDRAAADLSERLQAVTRRFPLALDLATPGDAIVRALTGSGRVDDVVKSSAVATSAVPEAVRVSADEEALPFAPATFDLVASALAFQWTNDLPGTLAQIRRILKPDGLLLAVLAGGETLTELRQSFAQAEAEIEGGVSPRVSPFVEIRTLGSLLQRAGFALPVADVDRITVRYKNLFALFADLRAMGATNALTERSRRPLRRATLARAAGIYAERFSDPDGKLRATFDLLWISGWAPDPSQQKPLRPGSARARLADALGTTERSAGEPAGPARKR